MLAGDELTVLEANAIPGLTDTSLLPLAAEAAGIGFDAFVARVLDLAVAAHRLALVVRYVRRRRSPPASRDPRTP